MKYVKDELMDYYKCQTDICYCSQLYGENKEEHGSKILMLFAEIYAYMVEEFGLTQSPRLIIDYENSEIFKAWFWDVKHRLGRELLVDPDFDTIGQWIGRGLFLKIALSIIEYHLLYFKRCVCSFNYDLIMRGLVEKQRSFIKDIMKSNHFIINGKNAVELISGGYTLLQEKVLLDAAHPLFKTVNIIK